MTDPTTYPQAERMADAYNLGVKAEGLREFAADLEAVPYGNAAHLARLKAETLDDQAEDIAAGCDPAVTAPAPEPTDAHRCWSCDHPVTDHQGDGCHHPITCALVSVETADFDALCSCAVSAESAASPPERDATQAGDNQ